MRVDWMHVCIAEGVQNSFTHSSAGPVYEQVCPMGGRWSNTFHPVMGWPQPDAHAATQSLPPAPGGQRREQEQKK